MARNFYYGSDASMASGSAVFSSLINSDYAALGLSETQALEYAQVDADLQSAMQAAKNPSTRTSVSVSLKNAALKAMQRRVKPLAALIRGNVSVTDARLISLGLLPRPKPKRRNAPDAPPSVRVLEVRERVATIRVCDRDSATGRSKPFGATCAAIFSWVGEQPPEDERAYKLAWIATRTTARITFPDAVASGATVWLSARWLTRRGETSVASVPISFTIQGGPVVAATQSAIKKAAA